MIPHDGVGMGKMPIGSASEGSSVIQVGLILAVLAVLFYVNLPGVSSQTYANRYYKLCTEAETVLTKHVPGSKQSSLFVKMKDKAVVADFAKNLWQAGEHTAKLIDIVEVCLKEKGKLNQAQDALADLRKRLEQTNNLCRQLRERDRTK